MDRPSRRQLLSLSVSALTVSLAGCTQATPESGAETETPSPEYTEPGCWPSMCAGTQIVEVAVDSGFSGTVVLEASCRDESVPVRSGESVQIRREADAEECGVTLFIDDERVYGDRISGHASVTLTVSENGEVDEESVVL